MTTNIKKISRVLLTESNNRPYKLDVVDADGKIVWEKEPKELEQVNEKGELIVIPGKAKQEQATVDKIYYLIPFHLQRFDKVIGAPNDNIYASRLWSALSRIDNDSKDFELNVDIYNWIFRVLRREIPIRFILTPDAYNTLDDDRKKVRFTLSNVIFGMSEAWILEQLKSVDERKYFTIDDMPLPEEVKGK